MPKTNTDFMARRMDDELQRLEDTLTALYANATNEVTAKFTDFSKSFDKQAQQMQYLLQQGAITNAEYYSWVQKNILKKAAYQALIKTLTNTLVNTDKAAMAIVRGELPYVIAQSYNFVQGLGWKAADDAGFTVGTFQIYNADAVQKLIKDNPRLLPKVNIPIDRQWNKDKINNTITHSIIQGDSIPKIADKLQQITNMDRNTALRTARTSMTYAENLGRDESYLNLKAKGLPVRKKWSAVIDARTRDTHRQLNNTYANKDDLFGEGILVHLLRCPADPTGDAEEIYNCRCRLGIVFDNSVVDHSKDDEAYEEFLKKNYPDDYTKLKDKDYFRAHTSKPQASKQAAGPAKTGTKASTKASTKAVDNKPIITKRSPVSDMADSYGVEPMPYNRNSKPLSEADIIKKVAGGDMTSGSCVSAAYAYCGNRAGYDVQDFRGGNSLNLFSKNGTIKKIASFDGVKSFIYGSSNDFKATHEVLKNAEKGKQYLLSTGKHMAVVKYDGSNYQYLELQKPDMDNNKWNTLNDERLKNRFGCKRSHTTFGMKYELDAILIDTDSLQNSPEFADVLKYINTKDPKKGVKGSAK